MSTLPGRYCGLRHFKQHSAYGVTIKLLVDTLVAVAHEAIIAGRHALFLGMGSLALIRAVIPEMADMQRLARYSSQRLLVIRKATQNACSTFSGFNKQDGCRGRLWLILWRSARAFPGPP